MLGRWTAFDQDTGDVEIKDNPEFVLGYHALSPLSFGSVGQERTDTELASLDGGYGLEFGQGFNAITGEAVRSPIDLSLIDKAKQISPQGGYKLQLKLDRVSTRTDVENFFSLDAFASAQYGCGKGSIGLTYYQNKHTEQFSHYVALDMIIETDQVNLPDIFLSGSAKDGLNNESFHRSFGTHYVRGIKYGARLSAVLEIKSSTEKEYKSIQTTLEGEFKGVSGGAEVNATLIERLKFLQQKLSISYFVIRNGLRSSIDIPDKGENIDFLLNAASSFPKDLDNANKNGLIRSQFSLMRTDVFDGVPLTRKHEGVVRRLLLRKSKALEARAYIEYAINASDQWYPPLDKNEVQKDRDIVQKHIDDIDQELESCKESLQHCLSISEDNAVWNVPIRPTFHGRVTWKPFLVREPQQSLGEIAERGKAKIAFDDGMVYLNEPLDPVGEPKYSAFDLGAKEEGSPRIAIRIMDENNKAREMKWTKSLLIEGPCDVILMWYDENYGKNFNVGPGIKVVLYPV